MAVLRGLVAALALLAASAAAAHLEPCTGVEDFRIPDGRDYRGFVNHTISGLACQPWGSTYPHRHTVAIDPSLGTAGRGNNYCRNIYPDSNDGPWCYTMADSVVFQRCDVGTVCRAATAAQVEPVVILPATLVQEAPLTVTLATGTFGADIYYSTDGNEPRDDNAYLYRGPFTLTGDGFRTIRAFGAKDYMRAGTTSVRTFTLTRPALTRVYIAPVPVEGQPFSTPVLVSILNNDTTSSDVTIYYTTDGSAPDTTSTKYTGPFWMKDTGYVKAFSAASGRTPSSTASVFYNIAAPRAPTPLVDPVLPPNAVVFGAVDFVISTALANPEFAIRVNGSGYMSLSETRAFLGTTAPTERGLRFTQLGNTKLSIAVSDRTTRISESVDMTFLLKPLPAVQLYPAPGTFNGPTEVAASFALSGTYPGVPIVLLVNGSPVGQTTFTLTDVTSYTVEAYAASVGGRGPVARGTYVLAPITLPAPTISPNPAAQFPPDFIFISPLVLTLPAARYPGVVYEVTITSSQIGASRVQMIPADGDSTVELASFTNTDSITRYSASIRAMPADPANAFLVNSDSVRFDFNVGPFGAFATPYFLLRPATDPRLTNCGGLSQALSRALFLAPAISASAGAQVSLLACSRNPAIAVTGLPLIAVPNFVRYVLNDLASGANSSLYRAIGGASDPVVQQPVVLVDRPYYVGSCVGVPPTLFDFAVTSGRDSPRACAAGCLADANAASVLLDNGGECGCYGPVTAPGLPLAWTDCNLPCTGSPSEPCGGRSSSFSTRVANHYNVINVSAGSSAALFPIVYGYSVTTTGIVSTTSAFDVQLNMANVPGSGGAAKFITGTQSCATLGAQYKFAADGVVPRIQLPQSGAYRLCVALAADGGIDEGGVFREVPSLGATATLTIVDGEDVPVTVSPASGEVTAPVTVTVTCETAGAQLIVTLDQDAPVIVPGPTYTFVIRTLGSHLVSAHATTGGSTIGLPVTRSYTVVQAATPSPISTNASAIGVSGYTYAVTAQQTVVVRLNIDQATWRTSNCGLTECTLRVLPSSSADCNTMPADVSVVTSGIAIPLDPAFVATAVETARELDFSGYPFSRDVLKVCVVGLGIAVDIPPATDQDRLSSAAQGLGQCPTQASRQCQAGGKCAAQTITPGKQPAYLCVCATRNDDARLSVLCTDPAVMPAELRGATTWNGTLVPLLTPVPQQAPVAATPQGSWISLFILVLIFAVSTSALCYYKKVVAPAAEAAAAAKAASQQP
jgi:hypothetical protein